MGGIKTHGKNLFVGVVEGIASHLEPDSVNTVKQCEIRLETKQNKTNPRAQSSLSDNKVNMESILVSVSALHGGLGDMTEMEGKHACSLNSQRTADAPGCQLP